MSVFQVLWLYGITVTQIQSHTATTEHLEHLVLYFFLIIARWWNQAGPHGLTDWLTNRLVDPLTKVQEGTGSCWSALVFNSQMYCGCTLCSSSVTVLSVSVPSGNWKRWSICSSVSENRNRKRQEETDWEFNRLPLTPTLFKFSECLNIGRTTIFP